MDQAISVENKNGVPVLCINADKAEEAVAIMKSASECAIKKISEIVGEAKNEELYKIAVALVTNDKNASVGYIQRKLRIGYNRAFEMIDKMEQEGFVSSPDHLGRRSVLKDDFSNTSVVDNKKDQPTMGIVKEADKADKNKQVQVEKTFEKVGKKMATKDTKPSEVGGIAVDRLRSLIERIERLEEEKKALSSDVRDIFAEAKSAGFDVKTMRAVIKLRKMDAADRDEQEFLLDTYKKALDL